eukprot:7227496-Prorocentrum_lima.AAC.1
MPSPRVAPAGAFSGAAGGHGPRSGPSKVASGRVGRAPRHLGLPGLQLSKLPCLWRWPTWASALAPPNA